MTPDDMAAFGELADLAAAQEAASADEVRRDETVPAPPALLQALRDGRVVRLSSIVHREGECRGACGDAPVIAMLDTAGEDWRLRAGGRDAVEL